MKANPVLVVLILAMATLGFWTARINSSLGEANGEIATLKQKLAGAMHDISVVRAQSLKPAVEIISNASVPGKDAPAVKNQPPADPRAALALAQAMAPGPDRDNANLAAIMADAMANPQEAWEMALNLPDDPGGSRLHLQKDILKALSAKDPAQAAAKLATISMTESKADATNVSGVIAGAWLKADPEAASKWVDALPPGNARDSAVMAVVEEASQNDLPLAFNWTATMSDPAKRGSMITGIVRQWAKTDPDAAAQAVLKQYPNNNNGRQATLLGIIQQVSTATQTGAGAAGSGGTPAP